MQLEKYDELIDTVHIITKKRSGMMGILFLLGCGIILTIMSVFIVIGINEVIEIMKNLKEW